MDTLENNGFVFKEQHFDNIKKWDAEFYFGANEIIQEMKDLFYRTKDQSEKEESIISLIEIIEGDIENIINEVKLAKRKHSLANGPFNKLNKKEINIQAYNFIKTYFGRIEVNTKKVNELIEELEVEMGDEYDSNNEIVIRLAYFDKLIPAIKRILQVKEEDK